MLMSQRYCTNSRYPTLWKTSLLLAASALLFAGCSTGQTPSPFFMYSSPLLDGEMRAQRTQETTLYATSSPDSGKKKQVYARQSKPANVSYSMRTKTRPPSSSPATTAPVASPALATSSLSSISTANNRSNASTPEHAANYVWTAYATNQIGLPQEARANIPALYRACRQDGEVSHSNPRIGDMAFFHNTFDANDDTRNNDWYTHVAIVENIDPSGQITLLGYQSKQLQRFRMNLEQVDAATSRDGTVLNSEIRVRSNKEAPFTQYLSGQLFAGYCSLVDRNQNLTLLDNWRPD